tara:strand:- start:1639 stop:2352 length:714 start_codon:yes stop_codon:yes gene_type:complete
MTINEIISRVRALYGKGTASDDIRLSDRLIYEKMCSSRALFVKREIDKKRQVSDWIVQTIACLELQDALPNECPCAPSPGCKILRSKKKIPKPVQSVIGAELESVSNQDGSVMYSKTDWVKKKYKSGDKYTSGNPDYFIKDGYLFITTNSLLKYISISGVFEDPLEPLYVNACLTGCIYPHDEEFPIDAHLLDAVVQGAVQELIGMFKTMPVDNTNNAAEEGRIAPPAAKQQPQQQR